MARVHKAAISGVLIGAFGLALSLTPLGAYLEENFGLHLLFELRGAREAPANVVLITIDKDSARRLNLPSVPQKWPRSIHARLIDHLAPRNPAVIAFDIIFSEARAAEQDILLADAIRRAGNVVLGELIERDKVTLRDRAGKEAGHLNIERIIPPVAPIANASLATAPFALPKVPIKVNRYWAFKAGAGDVPTLPVVVFQIYALQVHNDLMALLKVIAPALAHELPPDMDQIIGGSDIKALIRIIRNHFTENPATAERLLHRIEQAGTSTLNTAKKRLLISLIRMYQGPRSRYLNFYGPPRTIRTIPYYQMIEDPNRAQLDSVPLDLTGKAIFVGLSERMRPEQKDDGFYTVFSQPNGLDISGVEIAASAFGNILEDMHVEPLGSYKHLFLLLLWGALIGGICILLPTMPSFGGLIVLSGLYLALAHYQFKLHGLWYPLLVPLCFQAPLAFFGAVLWNFFQANKERQNIRTAFGFYLPETVVNQLAQSMSNIKDNRQVVYGTCMMTDAEQYTRLSENMDPSELGRMMNSYYEAVFEPVRQNSGIISDVKGDSMLALWAMAHPDANMRNLACQAALDIITAVGTFNQTHATFRLPTRIGMHSGYISLGSIGAANHFEYRPIGDIVNTTSRIEGLNKYLGTQILASEQVLHQIIGFRTRPLGEFILAGKSKSVKIYELIGRAEQTNDMQKRVCDLFSQAHEAYQQQDWCRAIALFSELLALKSDDGPSRFYLALCRERLAHPPGASWDGRVFLDQK